MQTAIRISQGKSGGTHYPLGRPVRHPKRNSGTKKEDTAATGKRHDFLTDKIPPLSPDFWHKDGYDGSPVNRKHSINSPFHSKNVILLL